MRKLLCVTVILGVMALAAAPAQAARYNIDSTVVLNTIGATGNPPISGSGQDYAGSINGALGSGAVLGHNDFPTTGEFQGTFRAFYKKGTLKATLSGSGGPAPGGGISFTGSGQITKGTGKFKGAKGKFTFTGSSPPSSTITTFEIDGSVKY
jgi:hypothetical protein